MRFFSSERISLQDYILNVNKIGLCFPEHKLVVEVDENGNKFRNEHKENERESTIKNILAVNLLQLNLKKNFYVFLGVNKIFNNIKKLCISDLDICPLKL